MAFELVELNHRRWVRYSQRWFNERDHVQKSRLNGIIKCPDLEANDYSPFTLDYLIGGSHYLLAPPI